MGKKGQYPGSGVETHDEGARAFGGSATVEPAPDSGTNHLHGHAPGCAFDPGAPDGQRWGCVPGCPTLERSLAHLPKGYTFAFGGQDTPPIAEGPQVTTPELLRCDADACDEIGHDRIARQLRAAADMIERLTPEAMPQIDVHRYRGGPAGGFVGYVEPRDRSWIVFVATDGAPTFYAWRGPDGRTLGPAFRRFYEEESGDPCAPHRAKYLFDLLEQIDRKPREHAPDALSRVLAARSLCKLQRTAEDERADAVAFFERSAVLDSSFPADRAATLRGAARVLREGQHVGAAKRDGKDPPR